MNIRIVANVLLALAALLAAGHVLAHDPLLIASRSAPGHGLLFAGPAHDLLLLAGLIGALLLSRRSAAPTAHEAAQASLRTGPGCTIMRPRPSRTRA